MTDMNEPPRLNPNPIFSSQTHDQRPAPEVDAQGAPVLVMASNARAAAWFQGSFWPELLQRKTVA